MSKKKTVRVVIEFVSNGFMIENYAENPYGNELQSKTFFNSMGDVMLDFLGAVIRNREIAEGEMKELA